MVYPQLYLGHIPTAAHERQLLRRRAFDLQGSLRSAREPEPTYVLLNFAAGAGADEHPVELLLLRPNTVIVGAVREYSGPIDVSPIGRWTYRDTGAEIRDQYNRTPLQWVKEQRDAVRDHLNAQAAHLAETTQGDSPFARTIGALICAPCTHPDSRISLDVDDHRQLLKILGLDELPGLVSMVRTSVRLHEDSMRAIMADIFGGRLWHDGAGFLFELAPARFQLRLLAQGREVILPLLEGENVVGRRRTAQGNEHRVTLAGDDLISSDHARIICGEEDHVLLRDTSKNGTWLTPPQGTEERLRDGERVILPGTLLRMGLTQMRLERVGQ